MFKIFRMNFPPECISVHSVCSHTRCSPWSVPAPPSSPADGAVVTPERNDGQVPRRSPCQGTVPHVDEEWPLIYNLWASRAGGEILLLYQSVSLPGRNWLSGGFCVGHSLKDTLGMYSSVFLNNELDPLVISVTTTQGRNNNLGQAVHCCGSHINIALNWSHRNGDWVTQAGRGEKWQDSLFTDSADTGGAVGRGLIYTRSRLSVPGICLYFGRTPLHKLWSLVIIILHYRVNLEWTHFEYNTSNVCM